MYFSIQVNELTSIQVFSFLSARNRRLLAFLLSKAIKGTKTAFAAVPDSRPTNSLSRRTNKLASLKQYLFFLARLPCVGYPVYPLMPLSELSGVSQLKEYKNFAYFAFRT